MGGIYALSVADSHAASPESQVVQMVKSKQRLSRGGLFKEKLADCQACWGKLGNSYILLWSRLRSVGDAPGMFNPAAQGSCEIRRASVQKSAFWCWSFLPRWLGGFCPHGHYIRTHNGMDLCGVVPTFSSVLWCQIIKWVETLMNRRHKLRRSITPRCWA